MANIKNTFSCFKLSDRSKVKNKATNIKNGAQKFKENFSEAKNKPRSKQKYLFLGFSTVLTIFGVTLFTSVLPAFAQDVPKNTPKPGPGSPVSVPAPKPALAPSQQIISGLFEVAATVCALAISFGSFIIGRVFGIVVAVGILKAQGK